MRYLIQDLSLVVIAVSLASMCTFRYLEYRAYSEVGTVVELYGEDTETICLIPHQDIATEKLCLGLNETYQLIKAAR